MDSLFRFVASLLPSYIVRVCVCECVCVCACLYSIAREHIL